MDLTPAMLRSNRKRRFRQQEGTVVERVDGYFLRFYTDDEHGQRVKSTEKLCDLGASKATIEQARRRRMKAINKEAHQERTAPVPELTIGDFWESTYLPWAKANLRHSTSRGYEKLWTQYVEDELGKLSLAKYRTADGSRFLTGLASKLGRNSLQHVRSLCSGIFTHALNLGLIERNPWHDVKVLAKVRAPRPKVAYTIAETAAILKAVERTDARLVFALAAVLGLRPSEIAGLRFEDVEEDQIHVRRAAPYGVAGETKTEQSQRLLPLIEPVRTLMLAWREQCGGASAGWLFIRPNGQPIVHSDFVRRHIAPQAKEVCSRWCGIYSGRHGSATLLFELTGDARAANQVLGNSLAVVMENYIKPSTAAGLAGLKLLEAAIGKGSEQ